MDVTTAEEQSKIAITVRIGIVQRMLDITSDHVTNEEIRKIISPQVGHYKDRATTENRKLNQYGHARKSSGRCKTTQGTL